MNQSHLLLMLNDGARAANENAEPGVAAVLDAMTKSLVQSLDHQDGIRMWRQDDLSAVYENNR